MYAAVLLGSCIGAFLCFSLPGTLRKILSLVGRAHTHCSMFKSSCLASAPLVSASSSTTSSPPPRSCKLLASSPSRSETPPNRTFTCPHSPLLYYQISLTMRVFANHLVSTSRPRKYGAPCMAALPSPSSPGGRVRSNTLPRRVKYSASRYLLSANWKCV